jgi:hypothetical protein
MNLVKQITDQLSGDALGQLGSLLGTDADSAKRATSATVPALLSALSGMMSNEDGAKKLTNALGGLDVGSLGNITQLLGGNTGALLKNGTGMLGSLFGDSMVSGIANAVSRFSGLNAGMVKSLLAYLLPFVLGKVAGQWKNQGGTSQALKSLFADQRDNIANAVPGGFSLADIPGLTGTKGPASTSRRTAEVDRPAARSTASWLVPLALALLAGFFLWQFLSRPKADQAAVKKPAETVDKSLPMKPALPAVTDVPDLASVRDNLSGLFKSMDTALLEIKDAGSAERAMPAMKELNSKIDAMNLILSRLPESSVVALRPFIEEQVKAATERANTASSVVGIGDQIKALIQEIVAKITKWISADSK